MVKNKKVKPSAVYEFLDFDDGFQNAGICGAEVYRSMDGGTTWKKMNEKYLTLYSTYGYYFGKILKRNNKSTYWEIQLVGFYLLFPFSP